MSESHTWLCLPALPVGFCYYSICLRRTWTWFSVANIQRIIEKPKKQESFLRIRKNVCYYLYVYATKTFFAENVW